MAASRAPSSWVLVAPRLHMLDQPTPHLGCLLILTTAHLDNCSFEELLSTGVCLSFSDQVLGLLLKPSTPPQDLENRRSYSGYVCFNPPVSLERRLNHAVHSVMLSTRRQTMARKDSPASVSQQNVLTGSLGSLMMTQQRTLTHQSQDWTRQARAPA